MIDLGATREHQASHSHGSQLGVFGEDGPAINHVTSVHDCSSTYLF